MKFPVYKSEAEAKRGIYVEDREIVALYLARSETAIVETDKKYGRYCHYIAYRILENEEDAREIQNDTYLKTWNTIPPNAPDPLKPYVGMISRQLALNAYEKRHTQKRGGATALLLDELRECVPDRASSAEIGESLALRDALNRFVRALPVKAQRVFVRRYFYASAISEIACEYGMRENSVSVLLLRTREKLKKFLEGEGFDL